MAKAIIEGPPELDAPRAPFWRRLAWFLGLALVAALVTALVAYGLKALLPSQ
jgi:hypothetical protein